MQLTYQIVFRPEPEGGFTVIVPTLPGCVTYGETLEEATAMAKEAISLYLEERKGSGEDILDDKETFDARLQIEMQ